MTDWTLSPIERARFLDGEGDPVERAAREADLGRDAAARARVERHATLLATIRRGREIARPSPSALLRPRVRLALAEDREAGFPSTGAGDSLPRYGRWAAFASAAAAVLVAGFVFFRAGDAPVTSAADRTVRLAAQALRDGLGSGASLHAGGTCEEGVASPLRFPLVVNGELEVTGCKTSTAQESVSLVERAGDPAGRRGLVIVPWDGKTTATDVGYTRVGDLVVFDVSYGRATYYLATTWKSVAGTATCAACHGAERADDPKRNPHRIFERALGTR